MLIHLRCNESNCTIGYRVLGHFRYMHTGFLNVSETLDFLGNPEYTTTRTSHTTTPFLRHIRLTNTWN